jgi:hypothetical protein
MRKKKNTIRRSRRRLKRRVTRKGQRRLSDAGVNLLRSVRANTTLKRKQSDTAMTNNKKRRPTLRLPKPEDPGDELTILEANSPGSQKPKIDPWDKYELDRFEFPAYDKIRQVRNAQRALDSELKSLSVEDEDALSLEARLQRMDPSQLEELKKKYEKYPHPAEPHSRQKKIIHLILENPGYTAKQTATMFS